MSQPEIYLKTIPRLIVLLCELAYKLSSRLAANLSNTGAIIFADEFLISALLVLRQLSVTAFL